MKSEKVGKERLEIMFEYSLTSAKNADSAEDDANHGDDEPGHNGWPFSVGSCENCNGIEYYSLNWTLQFEYRLKDENWLDYYLFP